MTDRLRGSASGVFHPWVSLGLAVADARIFWKAIAGKFKRYRNLDIRIGRVGELPHHRITMPSQLFKILVPEDHAENMLACMMDRDHLSFGRSFHLSAGLKALSKGPDAASPSRTCTATSVPTWWPTNPEDSPDLPAVWLIKTARRPVYFATKQRRRFPHNAKLRDSRHPITFWPNGVPFDETTGLIGQVQLSKNEQTPTVNDFSARRTFDMTTNSSRV
ncbi:MAG: hypothetical protein R3E58_16730 [Phycisphaerae bacterium]